MDEYPMRINKYLAHKGYATRKKADEIIVAGKVLINGTPAVLGDKVLENDEVRVLFRTPRAQYTYLAYYKPRNVVTHGAQGNEKEIADLLHARDPKLDVFPVGRLDKNSHGLIILTNDGRIVEPLLSPTRTHEKEYVVQTNERLRGDFVELMQAGVDIGDYVTKRCAVEKMDRTTFRIILTEGKNHQIKRMADALGYTVTDLKRVRVMNVELRGLRPATYRHIRGKELEILLESLNLKK